jgi:hypothetical protein
LQGAGDEKGSLEMFGGEIWREKGHTLATWRENEGVERGILPASLWGDGLPQRVVGRRHGEDHVWFEDRWMVASLCDE